MTARLDPALAKNLGLPAPADSGHSGSTKETDDTLKKIIAGVFGLVKVHLDRELARELASHKKAAKAFDEAMYEGFLKHAVVRIEREIDRRCAETIAYLPSAADHKREMENKVTNAVLELLEQHRQEMRYDIEKLAAMITRMDEFGARLDMLEYKR